MLQRLTVTIAAVLLLAIGVDADWPQFLGPDRIGAYRGAPIVTAFGPPGPKVCQTSGSQERTLLISCPSCRSSCQREAVE